MAQLRTCQNIVINLIFWARINAETVDGFSIHMAAACYVVRDY